MRFGTLATPGLHGSFEQAIAFARKAEALGFEMLGVSDSQSIFPDTYVSLTMIAKSTSRAKVGTYVTNPLTRHPTVTAGAIASVNEVSGGRAFLGIGLGDSSVENIGKRAAPVAALEEHIAVVRGLLERGEAICRGKRVFLRWRTKPVPIYIAAGGPKTLQLAGRMADGAFIQTGFTREIVERCMEHVAAGAREAGRRLEDLDIWWPVIIGIGMSREAAMKDIAFALAARAHNTFRGRLEGKGVPPQYEERLRELVARYHSSEHGDPSRPGNASLVEKLGLTEYLAERFAVAGTPREVVAQLKAMETYGVRNIFPALHGDSGFVMDRFASEVMSALRSTAP